jgi:hypothetical protein
MASSRLEGGGCIRVLQRRCGKQVRQSSPTAPWSTIPGHQSRALLMGWQLSMEAGSTWALTAMLVVPAPALCGAAFPRISCRRWRMGGGGASVAEADGGGFFISYLKTANNCTATFGSSSIHGNVLTPSSSSPFAYGGGVLVQYYPACLS